MLRGWKLGRPDAFALFDCGELTMDRSSVTYNYNFTYKTHFINFLFVFKFRFLNFIIFWHINSRHVNMYCYVSKFASTNSILQSRKWYIRVLIFCE